MAIMSCTLVSSHGVGFKYKIMNYGDFIRMILLLYMWFVAINRPRMHKLNEMIELSCDALDLGIII